MSSVCLGRTLISQPHHCTRGRLASWGPLAISPILRNSSGEEEQEEMLLAEQPPHLGALQSQGALLRTSHSQAGVTPTLWEPCLTKMWLRTLCYVPFLFFFLREYRRSGRVQAHPSPNRLQTGRSSRSYSRASVPLVCPRKVRILLVVKVDGRKANHHVQLQPPQQQGDWG